eukprot:CAMPEP_0168413972 /NCGR_PEP_ID=MMETSP0228-20121227/29489_1 /TAXON_ID=133427 /ORGANISM="Protoceratium reticulatum, Strain CCCM 535 (=CCMP 1889)" /LENGTH=262 /DNA_ID=CAMNT_0008427761 /DNA_START=81 /DNA_END=866 /DNA_ORIENTATION=+
MASEGQHVVEQPEVRPLEGYVRDADEHQVASHEGVEALEDLPERTREAAVRPQDAGHDRDGQRRRLARLRRLRRPLLDLGARPVDLDQGRALGLGHQQAADEPQGRAHQEVVVDREDREDLRRAEEDEVERYGEDCARNDCVDRLVQRQDPAEALFLHKGHQGLINEGLQDANLEAHPQQRLNSQGPVLLPINAQERIGEPTADPVEAVGGRAHGPEGLRRQPGGEVFRSVRRGRGQSAKSKAAAAAAAAVAGAWTACGAGA